MLDDLLKENWCIRGTQCSLYDFRQLCDDSFTIPRMTRDIDIIIELDIDHVGEFLTIFDANFYVHIPTIIEEVRRRGMFNIIDHRSGYKIDFVVKKNNVYRKLEFERRTRSSVYGFDAWIVSLEDLFYQN